MNDVRGAAIARDQRSEPSQNSRPLDARRTDLRKRLVVDMPFPGRPTPRFDEHIAIEGDHIRVFTDRNLRTLLDQTRSEIEDLSHIGRIGPVWENSLVWAGRRA